MLRAAQTRVRICADVSSSVHARKSLYSTLGTYTCRSIRSDKGPETFRRYRSISKGRQTHSFVSSPKKPHGHEFWLHSTHTKEAGNYPVKSRIESGFYAAVSFSKNADCLYLTVLFFRWSLVLLCFSKPLYLLPYLQR